uniref:solute carrier family 2, facilitated glucose transporter member 12 n=1 Tax=Myxine glutinosa TaxID=7769 RepID=UPI00358F55BB
MIMRKGRALPSDSLERSNNRFIYRIGRSIDVWIARTGHIQKIRSLDSRPMAMADGHDDPLRFHSVASLLVAPTGGAVFGYHLSVISGALMQLSTTFNLSCKQQELVVGALVMGALLCALVCIPALDCMGRRASVVASACISATASMGLALAPTFSLLVAARALAGFAVALLSVTTCLYVAEIATAKQRGALVAAFEIGVTAGVIMAYAGGYFLAERMSGWRVMFALASVPALLQAIMVMLLPDSPRTLLLRGQEILAEEALGKLHGWRDVAQDLRAMRASLNIEKQYSFRDLLGTKNNMRYRLAIGCGLTAFQQLSGQPTLLYYAGPVFRAVGFAGPTASALAALGLGSVKFSCAVLATVLVDCAGRRCFLLVGTLGMAVSVAVVSVATAFGKLESGAGVGVCTYEGSLSNISWSGKLHEGGGKDEFSISASWLALLGILCFEAFYSLGFGTMTWVVLSEIFPIGLKGRAMALASTLNWGTNLVLSLSFLDIVETIGLHMICAIYSTMGLFAAAFVYFSVPETKGRSLEEISNDQHMRCNCPCLNSRTNGKISVRYQPLLHDES